MFEALKNVKKRLQNTWVYYDGEQISLWALANQADNMYAPSCQTFRDLD